MSRLSPLTLLAVALALVASACSNPRCPKRYVQRGDTCKVCPEGSAPKDNECVLVDGGQVVEPVDGDGGENADDEDERDGAASDGGTRDARTPNNDADTASGNDSGADAASSDATATSDDAAQTTDASTEDASTPVADAGSDASVDAGPPCYADKDKDGVGAGQPVSCEGYGTDAGAGLSLVNTDCDDNNDKRSPSLTDVCGDNIDNDCDGMPDDESNNACGGPCTVQLAHQPGEKCSNGLLGACAKDGAWQCQGKMAVACDAPVVAKKSEVCGDGVDNDCDGEADEADAVDATTWYKDCDADGYASSPCIGSDLLPLPGCSSVDALGLISMKSCRKPTPAGSCRGWSDQLPIPKTTHDCDDTLAMYHPGASFNMPPSGKTSFDINCDGVIEKMNRIATVYTDRWETRPICTGSCLDCYEQHGESGARWNAQGTQPPCSVSTATPYEVAAAYFLGVGVVVCQGSMSYFDNASLSTQTPNHGFQLCR